MRAMGCEVVPFFLGFLFSRIILIVTTFLKLWLGCRNLRAIYVQVRANSFKNSTATLEKVVLNADNCSPVKGGLAQLARVSR